MSRTNASGSTANLHGKEEIDLPPDVAIASVLDRLSIYAALNVPELWQFDGQVVRFYLLQSDGSYVKSPTSRAFPGIHSSDITRFLQLRFTHDDNALIREFRDWIRHQFPSKPA